MVGVYVGSFADNYLKLAAWDFSMLDEWIESALLF